MKAVAIQHAFDRAASHYQQLCYGHDNDTLQQQTARLLLQQTHAAHTYHARHLLDVGCGTGVHWPKLRQLSEHYTGLDLSSAMVKQANSTYGTPFGTQWLIADAEHMPLPTGAADLVFSNLALQWCSQPEPVAKELFRVCEPGGRIHVSTLIQGSLQELYVLKQQGLLASVNSYPCAAHWQQALQNAGFQHIHIRLSRITTYHATAADLLRSMSAIGASRVVAQQPSRGLRTPNWLRRVEQALDELKRAKGIPLTYQVATLQAYT